MTCLTILFVRPLGLGLRWYPLLLHFQLVSLYLLAFCDTFLLVLPCSLIGFRTVLVLSSFASWKLVSRGFLTLYMSDHMPPSFSPCKVILALSFALPLKLLILSRYSIWFTRMASWRQSKLLYSRQGFAGLLSCPSGGSLGQ